MQALIYRLLNKFFMNDIEDEIIKFLRKKDKVVFDIGCFKGNFTSNFIEIDNKLGFNSKYYMFDPNPRVKGYLKSILKKDNIEYFDIAFDNTNSKKKFYLNNFFEPSGSSLNRLILDDRKWVTTRKLFMNIIQPFKKISDFSEINVVTRTLDSFCEENKIPFIDLLKIDAEGNEQNILNVSNKLLEKNKIHSIYVEIADTKSNYDNKKYLIEEHLKKNNFILKFSLPIKSFSYLSNLKATDNLFINNSFNLES